MISVEATNLDEAKDLLLSGESKKIILAFDIDADDFFKLSTEWCDKGAKIKKGDKYFVISMNKQRIPTND